MLVRSISRFGRVAVRHKPRRPLCRPSTQHRNVSVYHPQEISAAQIAAAVAQNPEIVNEVEVLIPHEHKKALRDQIAAVIGSRATAKEAYAVLDKNKDGVVSEQEFADFWSELNSAQRVPNRHMQAINKKLDKIKEAQNVAAGGKVPSLNAKQFIGVMVVSGIPMVGFGFVDNLIMITAGDAIDMTLGVTFGLTALAAAGLGNAFSDVCGVYLGGVIESVASVVGVKPDVTQKQLMSKMGRFAASSGGALGIFLGCLLGMFPLAFMNQEDRKLTKIFAEVDLDKDGQIDLKGVHKCLQMFGIHISEVCVCVLLYVDKACIVLPLHVATNKAMLAE